jgi:glucose-6-phosphate 1-dehydrogenase
MSKRSFETGDEGELIPQERERVSVDDLNLKVQQAEEVLLDLERRREQIERQKRQLEEIRRKQYEFEEGQRATLERMKRGLILLDQQEFELKREFEEVGLIRDSFANHLRLLEAIRPQAWDPMNLEDELTGALATIDQAKATYNQAQVRLEAVRRQSGSTEEPAASLEGDEPSAAPSAFWSRVGAGFAYTLPLLIGLFLLLLIWMVAK